MKKIEKVYDSQLSKDLRQRFTILEILNKYECADILFTHFLMVRRCIYKYTNTIYEVTLTKFHCFVYLKLISFAPSLPLSNTIINSKVKIHKL